MPSDELIDTGDIRLSLDFSMDVELDELTTKEGNDEFCARAHSLLEAKLKKLRALATLQKSEASADGEIVDVK